MMNLDSRVVVVVPTFNEAANLSTLVRRLTALPIPSLHLLVVDDASPDGTGDLADSLAREDPARFSVLHRSGKLGLGTAYTAGFRQALTLGAEAVVQMDADLSHAPEDVVPMLKSLADADVVVGSRYVQGGGVDQNWGVGRRLLSRGGNLYARWIGGLRPRDATSGFKAYRRRVLETLDLDAIRCRGFAFQAEVALLCQRHGFRVVEHPILFVDRSQGTSKMSWRIVVEALWRLAFLRLRRPAARRSA